VESLPRRGKGAAAHSECGGTCMGFSTLPCLGENSMLSCMQYIRPCILGISRCILADPADAREASYHTLGHADCSALHMWSGVRQLEQSGAWPAIYSVPSRPFNFMKQTYLARLPPIQAYRAASSFTPRASGYSKLETAARNLVPIVAVLLDCTMSCSLCPAVLLYLLE
jgi:hypothetical protein